MLSVQATAEMRSHARALETGERLLISLRLSGFDTARIRAPHTHASQYVTLDKDL